MSSLSSEAAFRFSERVDQLANATAWLARAVALATIACGEALGNNCSPSHRYYFLETLAELVESALMQVEDVLAAFRPDTDN